MDIVDDHGWSISVEESEEGGARFEIDSEQQTVEGEHYTNH
jgi:C4-dicarboxylate-specific signal transduction histidine kinase